MSEYETEAGDVAAEPDAAAGFDAGSDQAIEQDFASDIDFYAQESEPAPFDPFDAESTAAWYEQQNQQLLSRIGEMFSPLNDAAGQLAQRQAAAAQALQLRQAQDDQALTEAGAAEIGKLFESVSGKLGGPVDGAAAYRAAEAEWNALPPDQQNQEAAKAILERHAESAYKANELQPTVDKMVRAEAVAAGLNAREVRQIAETQISDILDQGYRGVDAVQRAIEAAIDTLREPAAMPSADLRRPSLAARYVARGEAREAIEKLDRYVADPKPRPEIARADIRRPSLADRYSKTRWE